MVVTILLNPAPALMDDIVIHMVPPRPSVVSTLNAGILELLYPRTYKDVKVRLSKFNVLWNDAILSF